MIEINLLPLQSVVSQKESEFRDKFFLALWICSLVLAVDLVIFFLIQQVYKRQVTSLVARRTDLTLRSEQLSSMALDLRTVEEKAHGFTIVSSLRQDFVAIIAEVRSLIGNQAEMSDLRIDSSSITFVAKASDMQALNEFITRVVEANTTSRLQSIVLSNLRLDPSSNFGFQVTATYK